MAISKNYIKDQNHQVGCYHAHGRVRKGLHKYPFLQRRHKRFMRFDLLSGKLLAKHKRNRRTKLYVHRYPRRRHHTNIFFRKKMSDYLPFYTRTLDKKEEIDMSGYDYYDKKKVIIS